MTIYKEEPEHVQCHVTRALDKVYWSMTRQLMWLGLWWALRDCSNGNTIGNLTFCALSVFCCS